MSSLKSLSRIHHLSTLIFTRNYQKCPFEIPAPIERGPTDLLQALADTVGQDETAPPYAYIDDPLMIPLNHSQRKNYFLSKEYGRRTALKLVEEWPTLFTFDRDQPRLAVFRPQKPLDVDVVEATNENLIKMIANRQIVDAQKMYDKIISDSSITISAEVELDLFRLLCYYNGDDVPFKENEKWSSGRRFPENVQKGGWKEGQLAEKLFDKIEPKTDELYSTLICSLCKFPTHYSKSRAKTLYQEMTSNGHIPFEEVYSHMIRRVIPLSNSKPFDPLDWLAEMIKFSILPNVNTFNAIFSTLQVSSVPSQLYSKENSMGTESSTGFSSPSENSIEQDQVETTKTPQQIQWELAQSLVSEMNRLGIKHSLTVYSHMLTLEPSNDIQTRVNILDEILTILESQLNNDHKIDCTDPDDCSFFSSAIAVAAEAHNESLLDRLINIYMHKGNQVKFVDVVRETRFITDFLCIKLWLLPLNSFLVIYKAYIPRVIPLSHHLCLTILTEIRKRKPQEFDWYLVKRVIGDSINARLIMYDRLAVTEIHHLLDIRPSFHLSPPDAKDYFNFCQRFIEVMDKIEEYRQLVKEFQERLGQTGADTGNSVARGANAELLGNREEAQ